MKIKSYILFLICTFSINSFSNEVCGFRYKTINPLYSDDGTFLTNIIVKDSIVCYIDLYNISNLAIPLYKYRLDNNTYNTYISINNDKFFFTYGKNLANSSYFVEYCKWSDYGYFIWDINEKYINEILYVLNEDCFIKWIASLLNIIIIYEPQYYATYNNHQTLLINSDNTQQSTLYGIGQDAFGVKRLMQQHTDENSQVCTRFTSPQGNTTTNITPNEAITKFTYDALGQLLSTTDPDGMTTTHTYDGYGRRTQRTHPDAGTSRWSYDHAGNLIASQTQSQINRNQATHYHYTYNQLDSICYEQYPQTNVYYQYDAAGRVSQRRDLTGTENFEYDKFGNVERSIRLIVMPNERAGYRFTTRFNYDVLGKMRKITYPDNEEVTYRYKYGKLMHIEGKIGNNSIVYLDTIEYDNFDAQDIVEYGNGHITDYAYNNRRWLSNLYVHNQDDNLPLTLQDIYYTYDGVGNIIGLNQTAGNVLGISADYQQNFVYDAQNRLTRTDMSSDNFGEHGDYDFAYSPSGMLHYRVCEDWNLGVIYGYNHDNDNHITNHQIHSLYDSYNTETYFLNWTPDGQLKTIAAPCRGYIRNHKWNEAGQLAAVVDNNHCGFYAYDGNGERVYKLTGSSIVQQVNAGQLRTLMHFDDAVMYVNPYVVISPKGYHKFYYNGSQRIASSISKTSLNFAPNHILHLDSFAIKGRANAQSYYAAILNTAEELQNDIDETYYSPDGWGYDQLQWECTDEEEWTIQNYAVSDSNIIKKTLKFFPIHQPILQEQRYFYHTDHLGSSSWITDSLGLPIQFIHYQPFGELYINYKTTAYDERFKFTGKERDAETDYDYFGARYYASICPYWISVDPLADYKPQINPYAYCSWNPIVNIDPDGCEEWTLNSNTGEFLYVSNKGGNDVDYYSVGTYVEDGFFNSYANYEIQRGSGTINAFRIIETSESTISAFHIPDANGEFNSGFFLERPGPDTEQMGQRLRIPEGIYKLHPHHSNKYTNVPRLFKETEGIGGTFDRRGILIHRGNKPQHTDGCLLPGNYMQTNFVGESTTSLNNLMLYIEYKKWNINLNIYNALKK